MSVFEEAKAAKLNRNCTQLKFSEYLQISASHYGIKLQHTFRNSEVYSVYLFDNSLFELLDVGPIKG